MIVVAIGMARAVPVYAAMRIGFEFRREGGGGGYICKSIETHHRPPLTMTHSKGDGDGAGESTKASQASHRILTKTG
jgi:hypothetical protein